MPYGTFVAGGALAGFLGMAIVMNTQARSGSIDEMSPSGSSGPPSVQLQRNANLMFSDLPDHTRVNLPIGEMVAIDFGGKHEFVHGRLDAADGDWLQIVSAKGQRTWVARANVFSMSLDAASNSSQ